MYVPNVNLDKPFSDMTYVVTVEAPTPEMMLFHFLLPHEYVRYEIKLYPSNI